MLSPRWRKVFRDLWGHKSRTLLVVLSIAIGVFAVGMILGSQEILNREMNGAWRAVDPSDATLYTSEFGEELLWAVRKVPGVAEVDARRGFQVRFRIKGDGASNQPWRNLYLVSYPDFEEIQVLKVTPVRGMWPPPEHELLIERASLAWMGVDVGDVIEIEAPNGKLREMRVAGITYDLLQMQAGWTGQAGGYVSRETLPWLGVNNAFNQINIMVAGDQLGQMQVTDVAKEVRDKVERAGLGVGYTWIPTPGKHPAAETLEPLFLVLGALGFLSLVVSGFLIINTLQALLTQQTRQIGMMKAIGANARQVLGIYYGMVVLYGLMALNVAIPLSMLAARSMATFVANLVNFDINSYDIPLRVLFIEVAIGLLVPLLAAIYPIVAAVRTTAREAMSDYGLSNGHFGRGLIDRLLEEVQGISRPLLLSLRNTFRRKGRLMLTLLTLTLGGAIFIAVFSVRDSLLLTLEDAYNYVDYDVLVVFNKGHRSDQLEAESLLVPGVTKAEAWRFGSARRIREDDTESDTINLRATRADSDLVNPILESGRWLLPDDENAVVLNTFLLKNEPDITIGDDIDLTIDGRESSWRVVGIMKGTPPAAMAYVNYDYFTELVGGVGRAGVIIAVTEQHDAAFQAKTATALEDHFESMGMEVGYTQTSMSERNQIASQFGVLTAFLLIMAVLLAVVGGIGLMGTMSLNVLERTREIGVMRALGAHSRTILQIVIVEGVLIGTLSWLIASFLAMPLGKLLSDAVGMAAFKSTLAYAFSLGGVGLWLIVVFVLATLASFLPARSASRISVREVLAYE